MKRRDFLVSATGVGGLATIGAGRAAGSPVRARWQERHMWVKDPTPFIQHSTNLEVRLEDLSGVITPNERFFVRNHAPTPLLDAAAHTLVVEGDAVERPVTLSYGEIVDLPAHSVIAYLECAGNWRRFFETVTGRAARGGQWGTGGIGCAEWTGTRLSSVLEVAGLTPDAAYVHLEGADSQRFGRPMPLDRAMDPDTLLAYGMNGVELPPDHGFPLRSVVPGWVASSSVKWVDRIVVSSQPIWVGTNTTSYVLTGPDWPAEEYAPAQGAPVTTQTIKSALALPWPARLPRGEQTLRGFAYSPLDAIERVEWSEDGGRSWQPCRIIAPVLRYAWARFEFRWSGSPGTHELRVRATDRSGTTQPEGFPWNEKGYLLNAPLPHPIEVA